MNARDLPKSINTFVQPETNNIMHGLAHGSMLPVEIGLLFGEKMEIILVSGGVVFPCTACVASRVSVEKTRKPLRIRTSEIGEPVVGWLSLSILIVSRLSPDIPVSVRAVFGRLGLLEPFVLCMVLVSTKSAVTVA
jgi:hypothetical protein